MIDLSSQNVLIVVAHPDDETIGCGGTISRLQSSGCEVKVLLPLRGQLEKDAALWDARIERFQTAVEILGATPCVLDDPVSEEQADLRLPEVVGSMQPFIAWADVVFTHWIQDTHQSHRALSRAVEIGTRPFRAKKHTILFETPSSTDQGFFSSFCPNLHVRISEADLRKKTKAMSVYEDQYAAGRVPADLENYARYRGVQVGESAAEAFFVARSFY